MYSRKHTLVVLFCMSLIVFNIILKLETKRMANYFYRVSVLATLRDHRFLLMPELYINRLTPEFEYLGTEVYELARAIEEDDFKVAERYVKTGMNLNVCGKSGLPLVLWATFRDVRYAELLLRGRCDPYQTISIKLDDNDDYIKERIDLHYLLFSVNNLSLLGASEYYYKLFKTSHGAIAKDFRRLSLLLLQKGASPDVGLMPPLSIMVKAGDVEETLFWLNKGADVNNLTKSDHDMESTPLLLAVSELNFSMALLLIEHGAKCDLSTIAGRDVQRLLWLYSSACELDRKEAFSHYVDTNPSWDEIHSETYITPTFNQDELSSCRNVMQKLRYQGVTFDTYFPFQTFEEFDKNSETATIIKRCPLLRNANVFSYEDSHNNKND